MHQVITRELTIEWDATRSEQMATRWCYIVLYYHNVCISERTQSLLPHWQLSRIAMRLKLSGGIVSITIQFAIMVNRQSEHHGVRKRGGVAISHRFCYPTNPVCTFKEYWICIDMLIIHWFTWESVSSQHGAEILFARHTGWLNRFINCTEEISFQPFHRSVKCL